MPFKKARANVKRKALPTLKKKKSIFFYFIHNTFPYYNTPTGQTTRLQKKEKKRLGKQLLTLIKLFTITLEEKLKF